MKKFLHIIFFLVGSGMVTHIAFAVDQVKTTDTYIYSSDVAVGSAVNPSFTFYIGDDLSGITNPVKSVYFVVSGVYTTGGTFSLSINSDSATTQIFTLPSVANPTPFEFIYKDPSNKISPTSAGSYAYTLNMTPSGVTLYGLGVKMSETHRYKPPTCGGMPIFGDLISAVFDTTGSADGAGYNSVMWKGTLNAGAVRFQFAASAASGGPWDYYGGATCGPLDWFNVPTPNVPMELKGALCQNYWNNKRYFRYKIRICSNNCETAGTFTPTVNDVIINWAP